MHFEFLIVPQEKSAGAIIFRIVNGEPHYLLLHYPSGHWEFAKGHIEAGEDIEQTIRREVEEETGVNDLTMLPGFKEYTKYLFKKNYGLKGEAKKQAPWIFKIVVFLLAETKTEKIKISEEHKGFAWLLYEQAVKKITHKNAREVLIKAHEYINSKIKSQNEK